MIVTSCPRFFVRKWPKGGLSWKSSRCSRLRFLENPRKVDGLLGNLGKWMKVMMKIDEKSLENLTYCNLLSKIQMILVFFHAFSLQCSNSAICSIGDGKITENVGTTVFEKNPWTSRPRPTCIGGGTPRRIAVHSTVREIPRVPIEAHRGKSPEAFSFIPGKTKCHLMKKCIEYIL